ncbi:SPRY domain-containing SOCS box protein 3 [Trichostrongylus colubriformis]|uniref:SPRY domain-containing SOCS box protein 3 n=1 Tax=Trichostrongylus colubriformis TaxID=6319 RepID=A0AAN8GE30_TRICO
MKRVVYSSVPNEAPRVPQLYPDSWPFSKESTNLEAAIWGNEVLFHPVYAFGTAGIRGAKQLTATSIVYWDTRVCQHLFGTSIMFGVGTKYASTRARSQFVDLLGDDEHSYGLNQKGLVRHCGIEVAVCEPLPYRDCVVGILFDGPGRKISFYRNGEYLCTPFTDIDVSEPLYPMVSSTAQQSRFIIENQSCLYVAHTLTESALMKIHAMSGASYARLPLPRTLVLRLGQMERRRLRLRRTTAKTRPSTNIIYSFRIPRCTMGVEDD